jgi:hypothetical protein
MSAPAAALLRYSLRGGGDLSVHAECFMYRSASEVETIPLAAITSVRVAFERDSGRVGWAVALVMVAAVLFVLSGPLGRFAGAAAAEMGGTGMQGVGRALQVMFQGLEAFAAALPVLALVFAAGGGMLGALGWRGDTSLTLSLPGSERAYAARGHDAELMEFAEMLAEHIVKRGT